MISIIAAIGRNRELGKDNQLLWHIPEDMKRFKDLTLGQVVIMGRKTYESLPEKFRPLPDRTNIVITRNNYWKVAGCYVVNSIEEAIKKAKEFNKEIFIIGGASIYEQGIKYADKLYLTIVNQDFSEADVYFPEYKNRFKIIKKENKKDENYKFSFLELIRI